MLFILLSVSLLYTAYAGVVDGSRDDTEVTVKKEEFVIPQLAYTRDLDWVFRYANYIDPKSDQLNIIPSYAYGLQGEPNYKFPYANYLGNEVPAPKVKEGSKKSKMIDQTAVVAASRPFPKIGSTSTTLHDDRDRIIEYYEQELRPKYAKLLKMNEMMETEPLAVMDKDIVIL